MIDQFLVILSNNYKSWPALKLQAQISFLLPKSGGYLRFETDKYLGELNFWESMECEIIITSLLTGEIIFQEYKILNKSSEMTDFVDNFTEKFNFINSSQ